MPFGILEDRYLEHVPGTDLLSDRGIVHGNTVTIDAASKLKRGTGRYAHIVLIPQPSDDPNDPLNWPQWKKEACFWTLTFAASLDGALSPLASAGYGILVQQFDVSIDDITSSFGSILLGLGCFMLFQNMLAVKFGHRVVYLGSVSLMFISCIWCAASPTLTSIRASRVFQGLGMSALQSLVATTIEQVFFVHERGTRSMIWSFGILSGITLGPLVYSYVIERLSWRSGFWFVSIALGLCTTMVFFFVPETTYRREQVIPNEKIDDSSEKGDISVNENADSESQGSASAYRKQSYLSSLKVWHGTFSNDNMLQIFLRPFPFLLSPVTWFMFLSHGMQTVWLSLVPLCSSTIFTLEYNFTPSQIGLTNLGGLIGIALGSFITGPLLDFGTVWLSKRNRGVYEPEFRLVFMSAMLFGLFGYIGWAVGNDHKMPWIGAVACITMLNFSMAVSGSTAVVYLLDTHGPNALHILALSNFSKNMVLYGSTFFANGMVQNRGVTVSIFILAACQGFCWLSTIPMYIFGKRVRSYIARHPRVFAVDKD
ncbi:MFS general substrate transporter [Cristinia sonorae]|uniref:MFS general substrate transporter n=1 Tax=Cristinia sonorae TaxID=1940300 RepID=A0A8K0XP20_9AGAR|nr:MFS general substrate transporter [Cristinia sonorae]